MENAIAFLVYGMLIFFVMVALWEFMRQLKQGNSFEKAMTNGLLKGWNRVRKEFDGFERLFNIGILIISVVGISLVLIFWILEVLFS